MANWMYGTIRIQGPTQNILNFLNNGLQKQAHSIENIPSHEFYLDSEQRIHSEDVDDNETLYISGSPRHFIIIDYDQIYYYDDNTIECDFGYEVAWSIDCKTIERISSFGLYVSLYGDEWGMNFAQYIVYENGELLNISLRNLNRIDYLMEFPEEIRDTDEEEYQEMLSDIDESRLF